MNHPNQQIQSARNGAATTERSSGGDAAQATAGQESRALLPRVDVLEDDGGITLFADLPGVPREQLELHVDGETLRIEGEIAAQMPQQLRSVHAEIRVPRFRRAFTLSRELDPGRIEANLKDGVLTLRIPKQEHAKPRRIAVQAS